MAEANPRLSIVITSYTTERLKDIFELLDSIQGQSYSDLEVVFVAERSAELRDRVESYARQHAMVNTKAVFNDGPSGLSASRNVGVSEVSGDIIAFVDDDVVLFPGWAEAMLRAYAEDQSIIGVTGPAFPLWQDDSLRWLPEELYWVISCTAWTGWRERKVVRNAWGMNMSFRREAFDACLFADSFGRTPGAHKAGKVGPVGDDTEFSINVTRKTGKRIVFCADVRVWHRVESYRLTPRFVRRQAYWQGYTKAMLEQFYGDGRSSELLAVEYGLLRRIVVGLLPRTFRELFRSPTLAWKKLAITANVLFHVALGFAAASWPRVAGFTQRYFS